MAHAHTKYIENNSKKTHSTRAQRLCAAVRKIFTACQENIYRLSRKYLQPVQKIFISCRKDFYSTVRNILHVQSETFHVYSQKHSYSACGKIFTVLAGKSPQYTQKKTCKCAEKRFFPINFARVAVMAVLLCVCGAASAWAETYYWAGGNGDWSEKNNWKYGSGAAASEYPGKKPDAEVNIDSGGTVTLDVELENALKDLTLANGNLKLEAKLLVQDTIFANSSCMLDLSNFDVSATNLWSSGRTRLYGNQNIAITVISVESVEFYGNTGEVPILVSKIGTNLVGSGSVFGTFKCDLSNGTDEKVLDFTGVTSINTLTIKGNDTNKLGITATTETNISLQNSTSASNLKVNASNVRVTGQGINVSDGTSVVTAADFTGSYTMRGTWNGWKFSNDGDLTNTYYWVGSNGDWSEYNAHWRYSGIDGPPVNEIPGTKANAEVHITTGGTVSLNTTPGNSLKSLEITSRSTLNLGAGLNVTNTITIGNATTTATLDLVGHNIYANTITNNGTVRLHGTQTVTGNVTNGNQSTVEFYGTGDAEVSKMGTTFHHLKVTATSARTATFNGTTTVNGNMTLTGANTNSRITINGTNNANIIIEANAGRGEWLNINYNSVSINGGSGNTYDVRTNCFDSTGNYVYDNKNGWLFPPSSNIYYWVGGNGDWSDTGKWRYVSPTGYPVGETPGTRENAEVHITTGGIVAQNVASMTHAIRSLEITNGTLNLNENLTVANTINVVGTTATLAIGEKTLTANGTWSNNNGTVTVTSGNATFARAATDNGTWTYNNTTNRNLISNITYNILNLSGTGTIMPTAAVTANNININANTTLALGANSLTSRNNLVNAGTINLAEGTMAIQGIWANSGTVTVTNGNATFARAATDNGTWTYNNATNRNLISNITYNILNLSGTNTITAQNNFTVRGATTINNNTTLALGTRTFTANGNVTNSGTINIGSGAFVSTGGTWTNSGTVTVTSGNATFARTATDSGTWNYNNTTGRNLISNITYNNLNLNGTGAVTVTPVSNVTATNTIAIGSRAIFDLGGRNISAATVTNNGTVRLYGTQTVNGNVANNTNSIVEYYGTATGATVFGGSYYDLVCTTPGKTLNFNRSTTVQHYLTLRGSEDEPLTINSTVSAPVTIDVKTKQGESLASNPPAGRYLLVNRSAVHVTGTTPLGTVPANYYYYYAEDSFDIDEDDLAAVRNGWKLKMIELEPVSIALAQIDGNTLYVRTNTANMSGLNFAIGRRRLPRYFTLVTSGSPNPTPAQRQQAMQIAYTTEARIITAESGSPVWIALALNNSVKLEHLSNYFIRERTENDGVYFHAISDFAVGVVEPRYAFDNRYLDSGNAQEAAGGVAIRNWDADQERNGQLVTESDITISAGLNGENLGVPIVYFDASPDQASVSTAYNSDAGGDWRIWLPQAFASLSLAANSEYITFEDGAAVGGGLRFDLPVASGEKFSSWKAGDQIAFLFELKDTNGNGMTVCHEPVLNGTTLNTQTRSPLYALRLRNAEDATSLDLWSFKLRDITSQRGRITIMNNVINVLSGENMILDVNVPVSGVLNIMVMTLDGTIVKYLQHGNESEGKHVYHWDGRNNAGKPVARGLYFIRIVGCTLDETRKVMAVWQ